MKKKIITILLVVASVFTVACGNKTADSAQGNKKNTESVSQTDDKNNSSSEETKTNTTDSSSNNNKAQESIKNTSTQSTNNQQEESFYGNWVAKKQIGTLVATALSSKDVEKIIGSKFSFSKESASCFGDSLDDMKHVATNPKYEKKVINENDFGINFRTNLTFKDLEGENGTVTEISAVDASGNGSTFLIKDNNTLILFGGGVFIELDRIQ
ncbi:hypothetical protein [Clostridium sp. 'White wine YQ']|uniref:hypothetical protein n=1 Tax=Clostridium sp. 'White wine YQ' TaxID=3027474 RepID=UPI0023653C9E|nr:hypothetical protein [Clostridium sp. 'White wine YQ']MDD7793156.1 hypothetical protein [Clostridium sp. 'White wine YQ']